MIWNISFDDKFYSFLIQPVRINLSNMIYFIHSLNAEYDEMIFEDCFIDFLMSR